MTSLFWNRLKIAFGYDIRKETCHICINRIGMVGLNVICLKYGTVSYSASHKCLLYRNRVALRERRVNP